MVVVNVHPAHLRGEIDMRRLIGISALLLVLAGCGSTAEELPEQKPTVTYDSGTCTYEGPESFAAGTGVRFTFVNLSPTYKVGFSFFRVGADVTPSEIHEKGIFFTEASYTSPGGLHAVESAVTGQDYNYREEFETPGRYAVVCNDYSMGEPGEDYATIFTIEE